MKNRLFPVSFIFGLTLLCLGTQNIVAQNSQSWNKPLKVIAFIDTECPISQSYMPELKKLSDEYHSKNVRFEAIFPIYTATDKEVKDFLRKYDISFSGFTDKEHFKTRQYHATIMPEVVLLDQKGMIVYQGAIDNWYVALGKNRPKPTEFYLRDAIEAALTGNQVMTKRTIAVGCLIND